MFLIWSFEFYLFVTFEFHLSGALNFSYLEPRILLIWGFIFFSSGAKNFTYLGLCFFLSGAKDFTFLEL